MDRLVAMEMFVRVAECGSFTRAAESLNVANATVTMSVRRLEKHLNAQLINRDTRRFRLTEEGEAFLATARDFLVRMGQAEEELRSGQGELSGRLHVQTTTSVMHSLLTETLFGFARAHPGLTIAVSVGNHRRDLLEGGIDVAIRTDVSERPGMVLRPLRECRFVTCASPQLAQQLPPHPRDLDRGLCIGMIYEQQQRPQPWSLRRGAEFVEVQPQAPICFNTGGNVLDAARAGLGVAHVLDVFTARPVAEGKLVHVYPDWQALAKTLYAEVPPAKVRLAKVKAFQDFLADAFKRIP